MRIIHFSDIHLSSTNYEFFINEYLDALITDLTSHRKNGEFDLVVITGDLVNCGGHSLYDLEEFQNKEEKYNHLLTFINNYKIFEQIDK